MVSLVTCDAGSIGADNWYVPAAFGTTEDKEKYNVSAVLEWVVALVYILFVASFAMDFIPAVHSKHNRFPTVQSRDREMGMANNTNASVSGGPVFTDARAPGPRVPVYTNSRVPRSSDSGSSVQPMMFTHDGRNNMHR